jgi:hypothetical protein
LRPTYNMYIRCLQSPVACRSMNMKVHQTLVWLNLLSFRTKGLAEPTIGIQSGLCTGGGWRGQLQKNVHQQHCSAIMSVSHERALFPAVTEFSAVHCCQIPPGLLQDSATGEKIRPQTDTPEISTFIQYSGLSSIGSIFAIYC